MSRPDHRLQGLLYLLTPARAFGLVEQEQEFTGSAARWTFPERTQPAATPP